MPTPTIVFDDGQSTDATAGVPFTYTGKVINPPPLPAVIGVLYYFNSGSVEPPNFDSAYQDQLYVNADGTFALTYTYQYPGVKPIMLFLGQIDPTPVVQPEAAAGPVVQPQDAPGPLAPLAAIDVVVS